MGTRNLALVRPDERPAADDVLASDNETVDAVRPGEDEPCDEVVRAAELEPVRPPHREVGLPAGLERADVVAAEHFGAAARREP
jgi:hypothetical protein